MLGVVAADMDSEAELVGIVLALEQLQPVALRMGWSAADRLMEDTRFGASYTLVAAELSALE